jgi:hypothetical protein
MSLPTTSLHLSNLSHVHSCDLNVNMGFLPSTGILRGGRRVGVSVQVARRVLARLWREVDAQDVLRVVRAEVSRDAAERRWTKARTDDGRDGRADGVARLENAEHPRKKGKRRDRRRARTEVESDDARCGGAVVDAGIDADGGAGIEVDGARWSSAGTEGEGGRYEETRRDNVG